MDTVLLAWIVLAFVITLPSIIACFVIWFYFYR